MKEMIGNVYSVQEREMREFWENFRHFGEEDEYLLCEVVRAEETRRLIAEEAPSLLSQAQNPSRQEEIYRFMKRASQEASPYLLRPFPGDAEFFHKFFRIFLSFPSVLEFLSFLVKRRFLSSFYFPQDFCEKLFTDSQQTFRIYEAEFFLLCLISQKEALASKRLILHFLSEGAEAFAKYMLQELPQVEYAPWRGAQPSPGEQVILPAFPKRVRLRMGVSVTSRLSIIKKSPEGVKFSLIVPKNFLTSLEMAPHKAYLSSFRIEKLLFWKGRRFQEFGVIFLLKQPTEEYEAEIEVEGMQGKISSQFLRNVPLWSPEFLLSDQKERILNFFLRSDRIPLEEVAEVRRGYFIRKTGRAEEGVKILSVGDIEGEEIPLEKLSRAKIEITPSMKPLRPGDIVIAARGTTMKTAMVPQTQEEIYPTDSVIVVSPIKYPPHLLYLFLKSPVGRLLLSSARRSGLLLNLSPSDVKKIPVPKLPPEQMENLEETLRNARDIYREKIKRAEEEYLRAIREVEEKLFPPS